MPNYIDQGIGHKLWSEQDTSLYNKLDFYLAKKQVQRMPIWQSYGQLLAKRKWTPNQGTTMKAVSKEPSPVLRNKIFPNTMQNPPKKDIVEVRENAQTTQLHWQRVESQLLNVVPSFQDFLKDHVNAANDDIMEKIQILQDMFFRTYILEAAPKVWVCGANSSAGMQNMVHLQANDSALVEIKDDAAWATQIANCDKTLDLLELSKIGTVMTVDEDIPFYEGSAGLTVNEGLKGKYALIGNGEIWDNWQHDPYLLGNRQIDLDVVTGKFKGSIFGKWTSMLERFPIRMDETGAIIAPQVLELNSDSPEYGEVKVNPDYADAKYAIAWACGAGGYERIEVGPPPAEFSRGEMGMKQFRSLKWNGEVRLTKDILVNVPDEDGNAVQDTNKYGHYCQLISEVTLGVIGTRRRCWVPILYKRARLGQNL
jgi:hypothetical protein